jgi:hypothetical protein
MYLHANLDIITRFAGKCGEEEAHRAYTHLQAWSLTKEARIAICHAGQVLRAARAIPPYQFRGPDSYMVYHAIMALWTYSMMLRDREDKSGTSTPARTNHEQVAETSIFLDDSTTLQRSRLDAFIFANSGTPFLHIVPNHHFAGNDADASRPPLACDLNHPSQVMQVGVKLLEGTHPGVRRADGPPLLRALSSLMEELGRL